MTEESKTAREIMLMIKVRAYILLGPWPTDLQIFIFGTTSGWRCGLSPAAQGSYTEYRETVLQIARELQSTVRLVRPEGGVETQTDKENPPA
jgi:hypothetical protein